MAPRRKTTQEVTPEAPPQPHLNYATYSPSRNRLLWITVGSFVVIIAGMWGWAIKQQIVTFPWGKTSEVKIVKDAQTNWNQVFKEREDEDQAIAQTREKLQAVMTQLTASSTATIAITATTTVTTTTTK